MTDDRIYCWPVHSTKQVWLTSLRYMDDLAGLTVEQLQYERAMVSRAWTKSRGQTVRLAMLDDEIAKRSADDPV